MQMIEGSRLFGRSALERLIGAGTFFFADNSGRGREAHIAFDCGCKAEESEPDRFRIEACGAHRDCV
jgi:hypothetical protein